MGGTKEKTIDYAANASIAAKIPAILRLNAADRDAPVASSTAAAVGMARSRSLDAKIPASRRPATTPRGRLNVAPVEWEDLVLQPSFVPFLRGPPVLL
jgi:hypothetical protein